jgi:drug/metabolite transporter (DMT)-like permease
MRPVPGIAAWAAVGSSAIFCTSLGYAIYFRIPATAGATNLMLVTPLMPAGAGCLGMAILGEQIHASNFAGMPLIGLGLLTIDRRLFALFKPQLRLLPR